MDMIIYHKLLYFSKTIPRIGYPWFISLNLLLFVYLDVLLEDAFFCDARNNFQNSQKLSDNMDIDKALHLYVDLCETLNLDFF